MQVLHRYYIEMTYNTLKEKEMGGRRNDQIKVGYNGITRTLLLLTAIIYMHITCTSITLNFFTLHHSSFYINFGQMNVM